MNVHISYIIVSLIAYAAGGLSFYWFGYWLGKHMLIKLLTKGKHPDLWSAAHFLYEAEREEIETTKIHRKGRTGASDGQ